MADTQTENSGGNDGGVVTMTATEFPDKIQSLGDQIAALTLKQAVDLRGYLKDQYGIEAPEGGMMVSTGPAPTPIIDKEPEKTTFDVILKAAGEKKINVIKEVRTLTGLGLKEAKEFVENPGKVIKENISKEEAEKIKATIEAAGGSVEIK